MDICEKCGSATTDPLKTIDGKKLCIFCATKCRPDESYKRSKELRKEIRKQHNLGFHKKRSGPKFNRFTGCSIVSMPMKMLRDNEYRLLLDKIKILPEWRPVNVDRHSDRSICDLPGDDLAYAIIEIQPDKEKILQLCGLTNINVGVSVE